MPIALLVAAAISISCNSDTDCDGFQSNSLERKIPPEQDFEGFSFRGFVTSLSENGMRLHQIGQQSRILVFSEQLKNGRYHSTDAAYKFRVSDIQNGDIVWAKFDRKNRVLICQYVCIWRRPSGRVPRSQQSPYEIVQFHERANAAQDFEMHGIPIPEKFLPVKLTEEEMEFLRKSLIVQPPPRKETHIAKNPPK